MRILNPNTEEGWQAWAGHVGIGAGELPAVLGIDHRKSPRGLYEQKMAQKAPRGGPPTGGGKRRNSNPLIREGKQGEDQARAALQEHTAISGEQHIICESPGWLKAQIDAMAELGAPGEIEWSGPAEIKIPSVEVWDEIRDQGRQHPAIYQWHYPQIQAQMHATGSRQGVLWFWRPDRGGMWCVIDRDDDYIEWMLEQVDDWVRRYLWGPEEPPVDDGVVADMSGEPAWRDEAEELVADRQRKRWLKKEEEELDRRIKAREQQMAEMLGEYHRGKGHGISIVASTREQQIAYSQAARYELDEEVLEQYRPAPRIEIRAQLTDDAHP